MKLLVATRSPGKMREIRRILDAVEGLTVLSLDDAGIPYRPEEEELEPYETFEENAESKASYFQRRSGLPTVADDSGIVVDALGGAPGVRSKRFAADARDREADAGDGAADARAHGASGGEGDGVDPDALEGQALDDANNRHLVRALQGVAPADRTARYVCVAVLLDGEEAPYVVRGEAGGRVVDEPRGRGGFGYDPHVLDVELGRTFAEMTAEEKDARSHRGAAFRALIPELRRRVQP